MFEKLRKRFRKWRDSDFLKWREDLNEYEKDFLIPELKGRTEELLNYFRAIDDYCTSRIDERSFGAFLRPLILDARVEHLVPPELRPPTDEVLARKFFDEMKEMNRMSFIEPLEQALQLFAVEPDLKQFGKMIIQINHICSTVLQIKEDLFFYSFNSFAAVFDTNTGQLVGAEPKELRLILLPFQVMINNIHGVANSTSGTIHQWHKEQMEWKTEFLKVLSERIAQRNNLLTIFVAVAVSWLFLALTSPYDKLRLEIESGKLKESIAALNQEKERLNLEKNKLSMQLKDVVLALEKRQVELDAANRQIEKYKKGGR